MKAVSERLAKVEERVDYSHKRHDKHDEEFKIQRDARHIHANEIQKHTGMLEAHSDIFLDIKEVMKELSNATKLNTEAINNSRERDSTLKWIFGLIIQGCAPAFIMVALAAAILKGLGKL